jgi:hypothetical protein
MSIGSVLLVYAYAISLVFTTGFALIGMIILPVLLVKGTLFLIASIPLAIMALLLFRSLNRREKDLMGVAL